jgi:chromosome segregation ATPase
MTRQELNQKYQTLAAQMGDRAFNLQEAEAAVARLRSEMVELVKAKKDLQAQLANLKDESNVGQAQMGPAGA